jgi:anti-sigma-K factor RskA
MSEFQKEGSIEQNILVPLRFWRTVSTAVVAAAAAAVVEMAATRSNLSRGKLV